MRMDGAAGVWSYDLAWAPCPVRGCAWRRKRGHVACYDHWRELRPEVRVQIGRWCGRREESRLRRRAKDLLERGLRPSELTLEMLRDA